MSQLDIFWYLTLTYWLTEKYNTETYSRYRVFYCFLFTFFFYEQNRKAIFIIFIIFSENKIKTSLNNIKIPVNNQRKYIKVWIWNSKFSYSAFEYSTVLINMVCFLTSSNVYFPRLLRLEYTHRGNYIKRINNSAILKPNWRGDTVVLRVLTFAGKEYKK